MKYHGTDEESGQDIIDNGLNKRKWQKYVVEGGDPSGFSLTDDPKIARDHAAKSATFRGKNGMVIGAEETDLPSLKTGSGAESFDPSESKIPPRHINAESVRPGVFKKIEGDIPPLRPQSKPLADPPASSTAT